jgi:hypothetical protein
MNKTSIIVYLVILVVVLSAALLYSVADAQEILTACEELHPNFLFDMKMQQTCDHGIVEACR